MKCEYFGQCGACVVYEDGYEAQLNEKKELNRQRFKGFYAGETSVFKSPDSHYRSRSEFKIWHDGDELRYAMNHVSKKGVVFINECPQVNESISTLMPKLLKKIKDEEIGFKLFGADFLSSSVGEIVVSLLYHKTLDEEWRSAAVKIAQELNVFVIGRSRKQKVVIGQDFVMETLNVNGRKYKFKHIENSFTQPNPRVNEQMISWGMGHFENIEGDLLELYCGAGNFTIPFATTFGKVLATEVSKSSISAAKENMSLNDVSNIEFVRMSVEEFVAALDGVREFRRMKEVDVDAYNIEAVFVDPPRSGMDEASCKFCARHERILYISCNPETLVRDLEILTLTHDVVDMAMFDQFPYTHHVEMGAMLIRKGSK
jgi:tRNA (uracil-5-)-methyltransferase